MLVQTNICNGCGSCAVNCPKQCIVMKKNNEGFVVPMINENKCVNCGICEEKCPVIHNNDISESVKAYAMYLKNDTVRLKSSSGGVFPIIAKKIISEGGYVCGVIYDESFMVKHIITNQLQDIKKMQGAKYIQSSSYECFEYIKKLLTNNKKVLFVGTPCQVQALKTCIKNKKDNLFTIDMICHGVSSPNVWLEYLHERSESDANGCPIINVNMRNKESGWSNYQYSIEIDYSNKKIYKEFQNVDPFMLGFTRNLYLRDSCSNCQFKGIYRTSDITLGDYWGIWNQYPEFDDNKGTSLVLVHTSKGNAILNDVNKYFNIIEVDPLQSISENKSAIEQSISNEKRKEFFNKFNNGEKLQIIIPELLNLKVSTKLTFKQKIKNIVFKIKKELLI